MKLQLTTCTVAEDDRHLILGRTYDSFVRNLTGVDWQGSERIINLDGCWAEFWQYIQADAFGDFPGATRLHPSTWESFPAAVKWLFRQPSSEYFFHLEDDWQLLTQVDIADLIGVLEADATLSCVNLRAYSGINDDRICLSPALWRTEHARAIADRLGDHEDPELQLRNGAAKGFRGTVWPIRRARIVKDIGREWMRDHGLVKNQHDGKRLTAWKESQ